MPFFFKAWRVQRTLGKLRAEPLIHLIYILDSLPAAEQLLVFSVTPFKIDLNKK